MLGNRVLLKWKEPCFALKQSVGQSTVKDFFVSYGKFAWKLALGIFVLLSMIRWFSSKSNRSFFQWETLAATFLFLIVFSIIWLIQFASYIFVNPEVSLREKDIFYMTVSGGTKIRYKDIKSCSFSKVKINEQDFEVLEVRYWNGEEAFIEIDPKIETGKVAEILKSRNIEIKPSLLKLL